MAVVEILDDCPTTYGRRNKFRSVVDMMKRLKDMAVPVAAASKMTAEQLEGKILTGVLHKEDRITSYNVCYTKLLRTRPTATRSRIPVRSTPNRS